MAISLTCPSCQSAVSATEANRGTVVRCTICHAEVSVPGVAPRAVPAMAIPALAVPAPAVAKSVPVAARPVIASPAVAAPALARPAVAAPAPKKSSRFDDDETPRPRRRARDDDDDDYDDNEDYRDKPKKKSSGLVLWLCVLGGVFFLGVACVGLVVYRMNKIANDFAAQDQYDDDEFDEEGIEVIEFDPDTGEEIRRAPFRPDNRMGTSTPVQPSPPPGDLSPSPPPTAPVRSDWEKPWKPVPRAEGFEALMPDGAASIPKSPTVHDGERILVTIHTADEAGVKYGVQWFDVPEEFPDPDEYVAIVRAKWKIESGTKPATVGSTPANQVVYSNPTTREVETTRATKVGPRIFLFTVAHNPERVAEFAGLDIAAKQRQFFESVHITANPLTKAPLSTKVKPAVPTTTVDPSVAPPVQTPGTIVPGPIPGATGGLALVGQIERFVTGVYLSNRKELWTFDAKAPVPNSPGVLRRYSGGSLKLLATVELPGPVTHAAVDEAVGKLYAAVVTRGGGGADYHERLTATAELHAYDLATIAADAAGPLQPTAIARPEGKITALVVSKTGKQVFATTVLQTPTKTKTRLVKFAAPTLADLNDALDLPQPVAVLRLAPEGKRLIAAQAQYNPFGNPVRGFTAQTSAFLIDVATWKIAATATLPGVATDVQFVDDARSIAVVPGTGQQSRLFAIDSKGSPSEITPPAPGFRAPGLAFVAMIPESERTILSAGVGSGVEVLDLSNAKSRSLGHIKIIPRLLLSGPPILADREAKVVVFNSGAVLNVSAAR